MKYTPCLFILIGLPSIGIVQEASAQPISGSQVVSISFEELPKLINEKNENLKAARVTIKAEEERTGHLARSFLPQISASLGEEDFRTDSDLSRRQTHWRLGASLNLYRGGRDSLDEDIRRSQVGVAKVESVREFHQELKQARVSFWEIIALDNLLAYRREELKRNEDSLRSARRRAGAGVTTTADAVQFELHRMDLEQKIKQLEVRRDLSRNRLAVSLGLNEHENIVVKGGFPKVTVLEDPKALKIEDQLDVKAQRERERIDNLRAKQSGRWWHPQVDLYASYGIPPLSDDVTRAMRRDKETVAGVRLSFDFGQGLSDMAEAKAKAHDAQSKGLRAAYKERNALATDHELRHDIRVLTDLIVNNEKSTEKAREFLKLTQGEYGRGIKNGPDLLAAFRQFYELQERSVELHRDLLTARAELESLVATE